MIFYKPAVTVLKLLRNWSVASQYILASNNVTQ